MATSNLTAQQEEILRIMQEECGEVVQMVSKVCRFGIDGIHLKDGGTNKERLAEEMGDLLCMIKLAIEHCIVDETNVMCASEAKEAKLHKWSNIFNEAVQDRARVDLANT
jgi:NTP pyrophosphatase (non-canonical NTP hydrolase)